eukprot:gnl/MRDRNA2_/MRDRNA2_112985_c0_seq1.p1 gnl/MRDRNA2_/MRDRNA2_112985_c0~~gnl/MRDRNA2_/MRDRNA2_112985_c0_seq1.p1  ORF type:complete len:601 (-),score=96.05 gnl/MRDRNA2_/MRDRNA2_112985_c0_seq1:224-1969(-)
MALISRALLIGGSQCMCAAGFFLPELAGDHGHNQAWNHMNSDGSKYLESKEFKAWKIPKLMVKYYDKDDDNKISYSEFISLFRERNLFRSAKKKFKLKLLCTDEAKKNCTVEAELSPPKGHLQPLGSHRESDPIDIIDEPIEPKTFWEKYVNGHRACLFRGVDVDSEGYKKWDEKYVLDKFGWVDLKLEPKIESRGDHEAYGDLENDEIQHHRTSVAKFITGKRNYKESNMYAVTIVPQAMAWEVTVPPSMMCGGRGKTFDPRAKKMRPHSFPHAKGRDWMTHIYEANLWIGHGRTRSQFHYDKENNMNCLYRGEKEWILIDTRAHYHSVSWIRGGRFSGEDDLLNKGTDWVAIDPDKVDLMVHHKMADIPYQRVIQRAGDCIFLPYSMLHWVNKIDLGMQIAVSYMWLPQEMFDEKACQESPFPAKLPLAAWDILWYFNGTGVIPQGYPDPLEIVRQFQDIMDDNQLPYLTPNVMNAWLESGSSPLKRKPERKLWYWKQFSKYADDPKKGLRSNEMLWKEAGGKVPLSLWLMFCAEGDPEGMLPCDKGKTYVPRSADEEDRMEAAVVQAYEEKKRLRNEL